MTGTRSASHPASGALGGLAQAKAPPAGAIGGLAGGAGVGVVDLLLAERLADFVVFGDGFGAEPDTLHRDGLLGRDGTLGVQRDLVLFLADVTAGGGLARGWRR